MPCIPFRLPDGTSGIVCTRDRRTERRCSVDSCRAPSGYQCDFPVSRGKTCDRHLCAAHAREIAPDVHYCPRHFDVWNAYRDAGGIKRDQIDAAPLEQLKLP
ncbi:MULTISPECIES: hypothetical protein [unclassified Paraburkholderia]|uniref:hypothetical protein n=1 Tax=unclassified Paraburkholderia TaxID=2615204 RepID=UPI0016143BDE|nr:MULTISPECIES: hypothetical protein [unclassified Paraburkholderia]MBB5443251.1 hypothetical protein [Paraburkholderia sp. WSM4177]MBB5483143.1 hypothetical protein [Paraburkholderia sp. WSM4180]